MDGLLFLVARDHEGIIADIALVEWKSLHASFPLSHTVPRTTTAYFTAAIFGASCVMG